MSGMETATRPPYYAVIFTSLRTAADDPGYAATAERMVELAQLQPGYLGIESVRGAEGLGITVSYWSSLEAMRQWKRHSEHLVAQEAGKTLWYQKYRLRIARVEAEYGNERDASLTLSTQTLVTEPTSR